MDLVKAFLTPVAVLAILMGASIALCVARHPRGSFWSMVCAFLLLLTVTERPFAQYIVWQLERRFPPLEARAISADVRHILVLTSWDTDIPELPYTSNMGHISTLRALEADRIRRFCPEARLVVLGSDAGCKYMGLLLKLLGADEGRVVLRRAANTWESAVQARSLVGHDRFVLVTSAIHMARAMKSFVGNGLTPIPAPADYLFGSSRTYSFPWPRPIAYYVPNLESLQEADAALYEILGLLWYALRHD